MKKKSDIIRAPWDHGTSNETRFDIDKQCTSSPEDHFKMYEASLALHMYSFPITSLSRTYYLTLNDVLMTYLCVQLKLLSVLYVLGTGRVSEWM